MEYSFSFIKLFLFQLNKTLFKITNIVGEFKQTEYLLKDFKNKHNNLKLLISISVYHKNLKDKTTD